MKPILPIILGAILVLPSCDQLPSGRPDKADDSAEISTGSKEQPVVLPSSIITQLEGSIGPEQGRSDQIGNISGTIYNGSEWVISSIDIKFTKVATDESRQFRLRVVEKRRPKDFKLGDPFYTYTDVTLEPLSSGEVYVASGRFTDDLKKGDFSWSIVSVRGYKP